MRTKLLLPLGLSLGLLLAACGQKGPLYLPDEPSSPVVVTPGDAAAPAGTPPAPAVPDRSAEPRKQAH